ncbi:hypothetical protein [Caballeronia hypogeia]|uniref:hypothetical protein n=1 Tax=Caballeronia hypogeia TaxID=1777140 RepID=UPI001E29ACB4|nr:hypothetical protein [Caballeronia hypogeia]
MPGVTGTTGTGVTMGDVLCTTGGALSAELSTIGAGVRGVEEHAANPAAIPATSARVAIADRGFDSNFSLPTTSFSMLFVLNFSNVLAALVLSAFNPAF